MGAGQKGQNDEFHLQTKTFVKNLEIIVTKPLTNNTFELNLYLTRY